MKKIGELASEFIASAKYFINFKIRYNISIKISKIKSKITNKNIVCANFFTIKIVFALLETRNCIYLMFNSQQNFQKISFNVKKCKFTAFNHQSCKNKFVLKNFVTDLDKIKQDNIYHTELPDLNFFQHN